MTRAEEVAQEPHPIKKAVKLLGPGFITGAADDDPNGIGTYAVAGASLGLVSGTGLAGILKEHYPSARSPTPPGSSWARRSHGS
jgi:Mn2+/Fe2+ NRAMP family transporter